MGVPIWLRPKAAIGERGSAFPELLTCETCNLILET